MGPKSASGWKNELSPEKQEFARSTTPNAHYTVADRHRGDVSRHGSAFRAVAGLPEISSERAFLRGRGRHASVLAAQPLPFSAAIFP
jgi:hypothetical protein